MDEKNYLKLNDISAYKASFHLSNYIWDIIVNWDYFSKDTVGKQFTRSIDSIFIAGTGFFNQFPKFPKQIILLYL